MGSAASEPEVPPEPEPVQPELPPEPQTATVKSASQRGLETAKAAVESITSNGTRKLFFMWACGTTDLVTDIMFLVKSVKTDDYPDYPFVPACGMCLLLVLLLHAWKLKVIFQVVMSEEGASLESRLVNLTNSPGLLFVYSCRPSKLNDFVDFVQTFRPWTVRMFKRTMLDMVLEDVPSLALNAWDMFERNNGGFLNWLSLLASIAHILVCWWVLRSRDMPRRARDRKAEKAEDGVSGVDSVLGVAEAI